MIVVGAWAIASPWALGFSSISPAKWNVLFIGLVMVLINVWMLFGDAVAVGTEENVEVEVEKRGSEISSESDNSTRNSTTPKGRKENQK